MKELSIVEAAEMLRLQDSMNRLINSSWLTAGYPFLRAVVVEAGEALEHVGWKWWKQQTADLPQVQIELVDILHFMLSHTLVQCAGDIDQAALQVVQDASSKATVFDFDGKNFDASVLDLRAVIELIAGLAVVRRCSFKLLERGFVLCGMDWRAVTQQYLSKNVLNIFRQKNGYKEGTYIKIWDGAEDNVHLAEISGQLLAVGPLTAEKLYAALTQRYTAICEGNRQSS
jgi:hypothetical protein